MGVILRYTDFLKTYKTRGYRLKHLSEYKYLFPIKANPILAGIVADLIGDGSLQGSPIWRADFTSKNVDELKRFEKEIYRIFKKRGKIRKCFSNVRGETYNVGINCSPVARILYLCGVPAGQKVLQSFKIPEWIKQDKECFRRFCQRLFSCEGYIMSEKHRKMPQIRMEMWKDEKLIPQAKMFFREIQKNMKIYFDMDSTITVLNKNNLRKDKIITKPVKMYIFNESVIKFFEEIGFEGLKQQSLKALLNR